MLIHWIWLSRLPRVTIRQKLTLLQLFRDPEDIYYAHEAALRQAEGMTEKAMENLAQKDLTEARQILNTCGEKSISILTYGDGAYPSRLKNIPDPPLVLYYKGCLPDWDNLPVIAVVGTRKASAYGMQTAAKLGYQIAACGGLVVSGLADGIDAWAMKGALLAGKKTVGVLGCGADVVYPAKNKELFAQTEKQGCILTEYIPGTPPNSWHFPQRNRIVSGLSAGVLVVEAPEKSGALNTAHHAADQGRDLFVVPGNIDAENCAGSNQLLREHAIAVLSGYDVVREYESLYPQSIIQNPGSAPSELLVAQEPVCPSISKVSTPPHDKKSIDNREKSGYSVKHDAFSGLTSEEQAVVNQLTRTPKTVDEVIAETQLPTGKVLSILTMLAMKGVVQNHPGKCVSLK